MINTKKYIFKNSELFKIIKQHNFKNTTLLIEDLAILFEEKFNFILLRPLKLYIKQGLECKAAAIIKKWKSFNGGHKRKQYLDILENSFYEIELKNEDLSNDKSLAALRESKKNLQSSKIELARTNLKLKELKIWSVGKRKHFFDCSTKNQKRIKLLIQNNLKKYLKSFGLDIINMNVIKLNQETNSNFYFNLTISEQHMNQLDTKNVLALKDLTNISDHAYILLQKHGASQWPTIHSIKRERLLMNKDFSIESHNDGVYSSLSEKLLCIITRSEKEFMFENEIKLRIAADATNVGMNLKLLIITFVVVNIKETAKSSKGHHLIGLYEISKENFENLEIGRCFEKLNHEIESLEKITVNNKQYTIEYFVGNDLKMIYNEAGLKGATSNHSCPFCFCHKIDFWDTSTEWSIKDIKKGARAHDPNLKTLLSKKIPLLHYIPDLMHLYFRIFDKLFELLIGNIQILDKLINLNEKKFCITDYKTLHKLETFIIEECRIRNFKFIISKGELKYKSFNGNEMNKIATKIIFHNIINDHQKVEKIQIIWDAFNKIYESIKKNELSPQNIKFQTSEWLKTFLLVYQKSNVTPYMHIFVSHLHEFVYLYGEI